MKNISCSITLLIGLVFGANALAAPTRPANLVCGYIQAGFAPNYIYQTAGIINGSASIEVGNYTPGFIGSGRYGYSATFNESTRILTVIASSAGVYQGISRGLAEVDGPSIETTSKEPVNHYTCHTPYDGDYPCDDDSNITVKCNVQ